MPGKSFFTQLPPSAPYDRIAPMIKPKKRSVDLRIETLRGFAILGVVFNHTGAWIIAALNKSNIEAGWESNILMFFMEFFSPLRMPLFTVISGWVYALMPVDKENIKTYLLSKVRRIIIPLFFISTILFFITGLVNNIYPSLGGSHGQVLSPLEFWKTWFYHFGHLWFLQAIVVLFILIAVIDLLGAMNHFRQWLIWLAATSLFYFVFPDHVEFWSLSKTKVILPFFIFGVGLNRFEEQIFASKLVKFIGLAVVAALVLKYIGRPWIIARHDWPLTLFIGTLAPVYLLSLNIKIKPLIGIGKYSYTIYLYHGLPWIFLSSLGLELITAGYQLGYIVMFLASGLLFPVVTEMIGSKISYLRTPLLGKKP